MTSEPSNFEESAILRTPLYDLHRARGARIVPFAGYDMPLQYEGIIAEHLHTRTAASLFDVSHMGVVRVEGDVTALEKLLPTDLSNFSVGRVRYSLLMNEAGGIEDDLLISRDEGGFFLVLNASRKDHDVAYMRRYLGGRASVVPLPRSILALQGPKAAGILEHLVPSISTLKFMMGRYDTVRVGNSSVDSWISRTGYTGEDGFELILDEEAAGDVTEALLQFPDVKLAGLGARDSLRLEAGMCLYGHELSEQITPVEAGILFAIPKNRLIPGAFLGVEVILEQLARGVKRQRVGLSLEGRAIPRESMPLISPGGTVEADLIGTITSGCYSPTLQKSIAMGYVNTLLAEVGCKVEVPIRGQGHSATIVGLPFVPTKYYKGP